MECLDGTCGILNRQQFAGSVTSLETANLVVREVDPDDGSRPARVRNRWNLSV